MRVGSSLGRYRITGKIGEGGMGQVFLGEDDRLRRQVAIKILPPEMSRDRDRLARMEREAHALAQLEHPNIAGIYGLEEGTPEGEASAISFLVMQYAEGETLAARIDRAPLPLRDAVEVALQIARALEAAHDKGIVHRDLKPANVVLSPDSKVKLLDFGLAKAYLENSGAIPNLSMSPTVVGGTQAGMILGTAGYMSPEQARGKPVDRRTDVWAFGCVFYEMLTGRQSFYGETVTDVLGAIVHREPEWTALPSDTPAAIRSLMQRCLRKDIDKRLQSIGDARIALEEYLENPKAAEPIAVAAAPARSSRLQVVPWALLVVVTIAAGWLALQNRRAPEALPVSRFNADVGAGRLLPGHPSMALSRDGSRFAANQTLDTARRLVVRNLEQLTATTLTGTGNPYNPFFSPDGEWVGFVSATSLQKIPASGGTALTLATINRSRGASWTDDDAIIIAASPDAGLSRVPASGGELTPLTTLDQSRGEATHRWPQFVPGHDLVIFTVHTAVAGGFDNAMIDAVNVKTGARKTLYKGGSFGRYLPTGHLMFVNKRTVFVAPFDIQSLELTGSPAPVVQSVSASEIEGSAHLAVSENGTLVYQNGDIGAPTFSALWVDATGDAVPFWTGERTYAEPRISPDGTKVAFMVLAGDNWDVWVYDRVRQVSTRLTFEDGMDGPAVWSPDSKHVAFGSTRDGNVNLFRKRADGSGDVEQLIDTKENLFVSSWSGDYLMYTKAVNVNDLWLLPLTGDRKPKPFLESRFNDTEGAISPNGRWVAYQSNESGRVEVYVRPIQGAGKWQVSEGGGAYPRWSGDGRRLFFRTDQGVMAAPITVTGDSLEVGRSQFALRREFRGGVAGMALTNLLLSDYDVAADGSHFVMFPPDVKLAGRTEHLTYVLNWFSELRKLLPTQK